MNAGWRYVITPPARRDLRRLDPDVRERVLNALDRYVGGRRGDVRKIQGTADEWRLRVGVWRVRHRLDRERRTVIVLSVRHRREAYRD